jgi:hypothetical protein
MNRTLADELNPALKKNTFRRRRPSSFLNRLQKHAVCSLWDRLYRDKDVVPGRVQKAKAKFSLSSSSFDKILAQLIVKVEFMAPDVLHDNFRFETISARKVSGSKILKMDFNRFLLVLPLESSFAPRTKTS